MDTFAPTTPAIDPPGTDALARLRAAAERRAAAGLRRELRPRPPGGDGLLDLASNDYLGLAADPRVVEGAVQAAWTWGAGSTGSRLVTGSTTLHAELEAELAAFTGMPAGLVCSSGYLANLAAIVALSGPGTLVVSDATNHASIVDGCRLSRARVVITPHRDVAAVERALADRIEDAALVVSDSVFSVDGDLAPIGALHRAAHQYGALLIIDEAHALGVVGRGGRGAAYAAGLAGAPDVILTVTLSKSLGAQGGAVLGTPEVVDHLVNTARAFIFDTGLAPASAGAALAALRLLVATPELAATARVTTAAIATTAAELGLATERPAAAICPVLLGRPERAVHAARICAELGVRVGCFRPPSVPDGRSCLRITGRADLTADHLAQVAVVLQAVATDLGG